MKNRNDIRASILGSSKTFKKIKTEIEGEPIEVRQLSLSLQNEVYSGKEGLNALIDALIESCYVPGTDERIFEDTDKEVIKNMPSGTIDHIFSIMADLATRTTTDEVSKAKKN